MSYPPEIALAVDVDQAYLMLDAGEAIRIEPRLTGYAPRTLKSLSKKDLQRPSCLREQLSNQ